eukprot:175768_1
MNDIFVSVAQYTIYAMTAVCLISAINGNLKLVQCLNTAFIQKRKQSVLFGLNLSLMCLIISFCVLSASHIQQTPLVKFIGSISTLISYYLFLFFCVTRQWMIYYTHRYTFYTSQSQWQHIISDTVTTDNWFILNKHKFGSLRYIYHIFGIAFACAGLCTVVYLCIVHFYNIHPTTTLRILFLPLIAMPPLCVVVAFIVIVCKTPRFAEIDDIFFIGWESKIHSRLLCLLLCTFIAFTVLQYVTDEATSAAICYPFYILISYGMHHVSTYSIYAKHVEQMNSNPRMNMPRMSISSYVTDWLDSGSISSATGSDRESRVGKGSIKLGKVLSTQDTMHLFMVHLSKEFSMELLLSLIEIEQFQQYVLNDAECVMDLKDMPYKAIALPHNVLMSSIVESDCSVKKKAFQIYRKYVANDSQFQINISFDTQQRLSTIFSDEESLEANQGIKIKDIFGQFELVKMDMFRLMIHSYTRFKLTPDYQKAVRLLQN